MTYTDEALNNLDPLVRTLMEALNWDWAGEGGVPSADEVLTDVAEAIRERFTLTPIGIPGPAAIIEKVRAYADDRYRYGRRNRTVSSSRIASDLYAILGTPIAEDCSCRCSHLYHSECSETCRAEASDAQVPTVDEWGAQIRAEQRRAAAKGYTAEHDAEHGIRHLLNRAIDFSRQGKAEASSGLILSALDILDAMTPESGPSFDPDVLRLITELHALRAAGGVR